MAIVPFSSSFSKKIEDNLRLKEAFESAETTEEMVNTLLEIVKEGIFDDQRLGIAYYQIAYKLHHQYKDHLRYVVADAYSKICEQYETMHEFETAISLLKRTIALLEMLPQQQHFLGRFSAKLGSLLLLTGEVKEAITYAERATKILVYSFGPRNIQEAYNYNNLGSAYLKLGEPQSAVQMFAATKDIMDASLAMDHVDTIEVCQHLLKAYGQMKSYGLAIDYQQQVINAWKSHGASGEDRLREAHTHLEELKKKASGFYANESPEKTFALMTSFIHLQHPGAPTIKFHYFNLG